MKPIKFPEANKVLVAPRDMTQEECGDLPVHDCGNGHQISCWELDGDELMEVLKTKRVWLFVWGGATQPPVLVEGINPFKERESDETTEASDPKSD